MMDIKEIQSIIPHRYPFCLIDRVLELEEGKKITAIKNVTMNENFFQGHFPGEPVMPGVLIIEAMAQAGAVAILSMEENKGKIAYFGGIDKAKFRRQVVPGDVLDLEVEMIRQRGPIGTGKALASVGGEKAVSCEITFIVTDAEKSE